MKLFDNSLIHPDTFGCILYDMAKQNNSISNEDVEISDEAIDLFKIWKNITLSFGKLITTLQSNTFNTIKNSELTKYVKENKATVSKIEALNYDKVMDVVLLTPNNMSDKYYDTVKFTEDFFNSVKIVDILNFYDKVFTDIYRAISKNNIDFKKFTNNLKVSNISKFNKTITKSFDKHISMYSNNGKREVPFKQLFSNMKQFKEVKKILLSDVKYVKNINDIENKMNTLHETLENMLEVAEASEIKLDKGFILAISNVVEFLAKTTDIYATVIRHNLALEHNYCINLNTLNDSTV